MYLPEHFRESESARLHEVMRRHSFATVVSKQYGELMASHLPLVIDAERGERGTLIGHMARANPQWRSFDSSAEALVIFHGPHAYISPSWYETELAVPTWNYVAVHAYGTPRLIAGDGLLEVIQDTVERYESRFEEPWTIERLPEEFVARLAKAIVGFEIPISRMEGKFKLNQNRGYADHQGVIAALAAAGDEMSVAVAQLMQQRVAKSSD